MSKPGSNVAPVMVKQSSWKTYRLSDITLNIQTGPFGTQLKQAEYVPQGIPSIMPTNLIDGRISSINIARITEEKATELEKYRVSTGDIVYSRRGDVEKNALVTELQDNWLCGTGCLRVRFDTSIVDPRFASYQLSSPSSREWIVRHAVGATMPNLNTKIMGNVPFKLPPLAEQKRIAHILGTLDDKIELNRRMNETLEAMAQALFKSWFIDFDPVIDNAILAGNPIPEELKEKAEIRRNLLAKNKDNPKFTTHHSLFPNTFTETEELGWVPEGWQYEKLQDLLEVKYGKDHKKLNEGTIPCYGSGGLMRKVDASLYSGESVLIPRKGTLSNIMLVDETFWTVDTMFYTIPKRPYVAKIAYYNLLTLNFNDMNVGSAVPSMTTKVLNDLPILTSSGKILSKFDGLVGSLIDKQTHNVKASSQLATLRNFLLTKLISK